MRHNEWFEGITNADTIAAAAKRAGLPHNSLGRQLDKGVIPAESVIRLARAYNVPPVQALVDTEYLGPEEAEGDIQIINWTDVTDAQMLDELLRRVDPDGLLSRPLNEDTIEEAQRQAAEDGPATITATNVYRLDVAAKEMPGWKDETDQ